MPTLCIWQALPTQFLWLPYRQTFGSAGSEIVIEEFLDGEEASFFALLDGPSAIALGSAQDHKVMGCASVPLYTCVCSAVRLYVVIRACAFGVSNVPHAQMFCASWQFCMYINDTLLDTCQAVGDGDTGPNTGGMGAYNPAPVVDAAMERQIMEDIVLPTARGMVAEGCPFRGVLFAGLMIKDGKAKLLEHNVRFGDPECQVGVQIVLYALLLLDLCMCL